jgi:large subunit ribosomal protein L25
MAETTTFAAEERAASGKGGARKLRRSGRVPGVIYGEKKEQQLISLESRLLKRALGDPHFHSTLCTLQLDGQEIRTLPREVQVHPVTEEPIHADFERVSRGSKVTVTVPVHFVNEEASPGLKRGGVLNVVRREVEIVCPADGIPSEIEVDLAGFDINDSVHISNAALPAGVQPTITDRDFTIATISAPSVMTAEEEEAEAEAEEEEAEEKEEEEEAETEER